MSPLPAPISSARDLAMPSFRVLGDIVRSISWARKLVMRPKTRASAARRLPARLKRMCCCIIQASQRFRNVSYHPFLHPDETVTEKIKPDIFPRGHHRMQGEGARRIRRRGWEWLREKNRD